MSRLKEAASSDHWDPDWNKWWKMDGWVLMSHSLMVSGVNLDSINYINMVLCRVAADAGFTESFGMKVGLCCENVTQLQPRC